MTGEGMDDRAAGRAGIVYQAQPAVCLLSCPSPASSTLQPFQKKQTPEASTALGGKLNKEETR